MSLIIILVSVCTLFSQGKCTRREPACKYLHPPQHLKELLLQNGRNNLILRNLHNAIFQKHAVATAAALTMAQLQQVGQLGMQLPVSPLIQFAPDAAAASRLSQTATSAAQLPVVRFSSPLLSSPLLFRVRCSVSEPVEREHVASPPNACRVRSLFTPISPDTRMHIHQRALVHQWGGRRPTS